MTDLEVRVLNPVVILTMVLAGLAYARVLWAVNLRPTGVLFVVATAPGAIYIITIWAIRAVQNTPSLIWPYLLVDWFIFATTAFIAVVVARRRRLR